MRIHKTKYASLTNEDLLKLADHQEFNISELGLEFMERLTESIETSQDEISDLENEISNLESEIESLEYDNKSLQDRLDELE